MQLESDPRGLGIGPATGGDHAALGGLEGLAGIGVELSSCGDQRLGETLVEGMAAQAERGFGQVVTVDQRSVAKPCHGGGREGVFEMGAKSQSIDGGSIEGGDEFTANPMTRIAAGFVHDDRNAGSAQAEGEAQPGEGRGLARRTAPEFALVQHRAQSLEHQHHTDGGLIAHSLALAPELGRRGRFVLVPDELHEPLRQRMVLLGNASPPAIRLYDFMHASASRAVFERYGFALPPD